MLLPFGNTILQNGIMNKETDPQSWWKWAITPPQSYGVYFAALVLVYLLSFYAGTLKPKGPTGLGPPPAPVPTVPRN